MKTSFSRNLLISTFLWIICILLVDGLEKVLLISIFLFIPILLSLIPTIKRDESSSSYHALLLNSHLYVAVTIGIALLFSTGNILSGILSIPWAVFTLGFFVYGIRRFMERGGYIIEENAIDTSFLYVLLGGITLSIYCFTSDKIINHHLLVTTIHFHFTAVLSTLFVGLVGRVIPFDQKIGHSYRWTVRGIIISPLIIGIGILTEPWVQNAGLWIYTICIMMYSYFVFLHIEKKNTITSLCIQLSAVVMVITTVLSVIQGIFQLQRLAWIHVEQWIWYHEIPLAIGFVLGIFGWYFLKPTEKNNIYQLPQININGDMYIGKDFLQRNGYEDPKVSHAGIMYNLDQFARADFIPNLLHPKVRSFFENTSLYDVAIQAHWKKAAWLFEKLHRVWTNKLQQTNVPSPGGTIIPLNSEIVSVINKEQYWNKKLHAWVLSYQDSDDTFVVGIYSDHKHNNERYLNITFPINKSNRATFFRLEHGIDGSLQLTSIPRRGGMGDEGNFLMLKNFSIRLPLNEHFYIWVDEYGRLQVTHRFWFFGVRIVNIEYEMIAK
jgi:hypothetical protein